MARGNSDVSPRKTTATGNESDCQTAKSYDSPLISENTSFSSREKKNTSGGSYREPSFMDGLKSIRLSDLKEVHNIPCARESLLTGIGAGFGIGGVRAILGARVFVACNWAVGSFVIGSILMHRFCQQRRTLEKQGMKRIVEVVERKRSEKKLHALEAGQKGLAAEEVDIKTPKK